MSTSRAASPARSRGTAATVPGALPLAAARASASCPWGEVGALPVDLPLEDYPGVLLTRVAQSIHQEISADYAREHGLSASEWRMLARLAVEPPMLLRDLCVALALDKAYASRMLRTLEQRGLLRVSGDPSNGRRLVVACTPTGRTLAKRLMPRVREAQGRLLALLDSQERAALYSALKKLQAAIETRALVSRTGRRSQP